MQLLNSKILYNNKNTKYSNKKAQDILNLVLFMFCSFFVLQRWRRWRELNPRVAMNDLSVFKTDLFDHLSTPPCKTMKLCGKCVLDKVLDKAPKSIRTHFWGAKKSGVTRVFKNCLPFWQHFFKPCSLFQLRSIRDCQKSIYRHSVLHGRLFLA